jgi:hypothetical protein
MVDDRRSTLSRALYAGAQVLFWLAREINLAVFAPAAIEHDVAGTPIEPLSVRLDNVPTIIGLSRYLS